jgi:hypothetical protein
VLLVVAAAKMVEENARQKNTKKRFQIVAVRAKETDKKGVLKSPFCKVLKKAKKNLRKLKSK